MSWAWRWPGWLVRYLLADGEPLVVAVRRDVLQAVGPEGVPGPVGL